MAKNRSREIPPTQSGGRRVEPRTVIALDITQQTGYSHPMNKKLLSEVMRYLGSQKSAAKAKAARENGKRGGRPRTKGKR
jgi:hypothetical protein